MKYVSPRYEQIAFECEDIMFLSGIFDFTEDPNTPENDVSVSVDVENLMP